MSVAGEGQHLRPVFLASAVDDHPSHSFTHACGEQLRLPSGKAIVLQMIVGVVEGH